MKRRAILLVAGPGFQAAGGYSTRPNAMYMPLSIRRAINVTVIAASLVVATSGVIVAWKISRIIDAPPVTHAISARQR